MKITRLEQLANEPVSHNPAIQKQVMLHCNDLPHLTNFSQARFPPGEIASTHVHQDMWEVFFVEQGTGIIRINDQDYEIAPGTCTAVEPGEFHQVQNTGETELVLTYFGLRVGINPKDASN